MKNLTIQARVLIIAMVPVLALTVFLMLYNFSQTRAIGDQVVAEFTVDMENSKKMELKNYLQLAVSTVQPLLQAGAGNLQSAPVQESWQVLRRLRFDDLGQDGYFFVFDDTATLYVHGANGALEGKNLWNFQDPHGVYLVRELIQAAKKGGDFVSYHWKNSDTAEVAPKLSYAAKLPGTDLMIATGFWISGLESQVLQMQNNVNTSTEDALLGSVLTAFAMLVVIVALALLVARSIIHPLRSAVAAMRDVASGDGDLTRRLSVKGNDELSHLGQAFNTFADQVHGLVGNMRTSITTLNGAVQELNEIMTTAADGVNRQKNESDQVATAMYEMTAAAREVAGNAVQAAEAADNAGGQVGNAQHLVDHAVQVIGGLSAQVTQGVQVIRQLGDDSARVDSVLEVIRSIADQTNLLALNAAIEAARAGEAGRGFAVVADEVRTLASRTQQSTVEIQQTIERLQQGADNAVRLIAAISEHSEATVAETRQVSDALQEIHRAVGIITEMNSQIATAAEEQTSVAETINQNVHEIVSISELTAEGTRRADTTTHRLQEMAAGMFEQTSRYQL